MFARLAKFRPFEPQRVMPRRCEAMHSNDNLPGRRRPASKRRSPPPALACHWYLNDRDGRLECRWEAAELEEGQSVTQGAIFGLTKPPVAPFVSSSG
jgi:hypothetical protein